MMFVSCLLCLFALCQGILGTKPSCEAENKALSSDGVSCYECGRSNVSTKQGQSTVEYKQTASVGDFPWHATIYKNSGNAEWQQICGGTLITSQVVITAAYCVTSTSHKLPFVTVEDTSNIKVILGKTNILLNVTEPSESRQEVSQVVLHPNFKGPSLNYAANIALITLKNKVVLSESLMPACLDFNHNNNLRHKDEIGYMAGYGYVTDCFGPTCTSITESLQYTSAPIMSVSDCFDTIQSKHYSLFLNLNVDNFCFGNGTVSPITKGNGGDGITVIKQDLHYLSGVASIKLFREDAYSFGSATNVTLYMNWIKANLPVNK